MLQNQMNDQGRFLKSCLALKKWFSLYFIIKANHSIFLTLIYIISGTSTKMGNMKHRYFLIWSMVNLLIQLCEAGKNIHSLHFMKIKSLCSVNIAAHILIKTENIIIGSCECGFCGPDHKDCDFLLSTQCKNNGIRDPNYMRNGCKNCPNFRVLCPETCNYCPSTSAQQTTSSLTTTRQSTTATTTDAKGNLAHN